MEANTDANANKNRNYEEDMFQGGYVASFSEDHVNMNENIIPGYEDDRDGMNQHQQQQEEEGMGYDSSGTTDVAGELESRSSSETPSETAAASETTSSSTYSSRGRPSRHRNNTLDLAGIANWKRPWTEDEDKKLCALTSQYGIAKWSHIADSLPERTGKQCRERWHNHLAPAIKKGGWSAEEDAIIFVLQNEYGNQWSKITKHLNGRTDNAVKNRFHVILRASKNGKNVDVSAAPADLLLNFPRGSANGSGRSKSVIEMGEGADVLASMSSDDSHYDMNEANYSLPFPHSSIYDPAIIFPSVTMGTGDRVGQVQGGIGMGFGSTSFSKDSLLPVSPRGLSAAAALSSLEGDMNVYDMNGSSGSENTREYKQSKNPSYSLSSSSSPTSDSSRIRTKYGSQYASGLFSATYDGSGSGTGTSISEKQFRKPFASNQILNNGTGADNVGMGMGMGMGMPNRYQHNSYYSTHAVASSPQGIGDDVIPGGDLDGNLNGNGGGEGGRVGPWHGQASLYHLSDERLHDNVFSLVSGGPAPGIDLVNGGQLGTNSMVSGSPLFLDGFPISRGPSASGSEMSSGSIKSVGSYESGFEQAIGKTDFFSGGNGENSGKWSSSNEGSCKSINGNNIRSSSSSKSTAASPWPFERSSTGSTGRSSVMSMDDKGDEEDEMYDANGRRILNGNGNENYNSDIDDEQYEHERPGQMALIRTGETIMIPPQGHPPLGPDMVLIPPQVRTKPEGARSGFLSRVGSKINNVFSS